MRKTENVIRKQRASNNKRQKIYRYNILHLVYEYLTLDECIQNYWKVFDAGYCYWYTQNDFRFRQGAEIDIHKVDDDVIFATLYKFPSKGIKFCFRKKIFIFLQWLILLHKKFLSQYCNCNVGHEPYGISCRRIRKLQGKIYFRKSW